MNTVISHGAVNSRVREAKDRQVRSNLSRLAMNKYDRNRFKELSRRCQEYLATYAMIEMFLREKLIDTEEYLKRLSRAHEKYESEALKIIRHCSRRIVKAIKSLFGQPGTHEFAEAFAV